MFPEPQLLTDALNHLDSGTSQQLSKKMFLLPQHPLLFLNMLTVLSPNLFRFLWYQWLILGHRGPVQAKAEAGSSKAESQQTVSKLCWGRAAVLIWEC